MLQNFIKNRIKYELPKNSINGLCGVCGESNKCYDILKDTFTNLDMLKNKMICKNCVPLFSDKWRKSAFYFTKKKLIKLKQNEFEDLIFKEKLEFPCILSFSESRKKHRLFKSKISYSNEKINISTDSGMVTLCLHKDQKLFTHLKQIYNWKFPKSAIKTGNYHSGYFKKFNIPITNFLISENYLKRFRNTLKFNLLLQFINND